MATKLKSMKIDPKAREEKYEASAVVDRPMYPWGLQLNLDNETLEKLDVELPKVGKSMMIYARVDVTSVSENEHSLDGKTTTNRSASLQITDLCLEADAGEGSAVTDRLYGKGD
jgi:hypothetical protein